jgi:hypothetical protein
MQSFFRLEQVRETFEIVTIGPTQVKRQRNTSSIDEQMPLGPRFAQIGRVRPRRFTPKRSR